MSVLEGCQDTSQAKSEREMAHDHGHLRTGLGFLNGFCKRSHFWARISEVCVWAGGGAERERRGLGG